jgi:hypothetical protein
MKIIPSKTQWNKWSLPSKAGYISAWLGGIGFVIIILSLFLQLPPNSDRKRPLISILSLDSFLHEDSLETKFSIKNVGNKPAFILIKGEASIDTNRIEAINQKSETQVQTIMPDQIVGYWGLKVKGNVFKMLTSGTSVSDITQTINISYGDSEKTIGEYYTFQKVKLDLEKFVRLKERSQKFDGLWLLEESKSK